MSSHAAPAKKSHGSSHSPSHGHKKSHAPKAHPVQEDTWNPGKPLADLITMFDFSD